MEFADPKAVLSVDEPLDAEQEKQAAAEAIRQEYAQREGGITDGVLQFNAGDEYSIVDEQGQPHTVKVVGEAVDEQGQPIDGAVSVMLDGQQAVLPKEQIQQMSDAETLSRLNASLQEREAVRQELAAREQARAQTARPQYALNDEVTLRDGNGNIVRGSITAEMNEDGLYEVYTESPINGRTVNMFTADELQGMLVEHNGEVVEQPQAETEIQEAGQTVNNVETEAADVTEAPAMEEQQPTADPMPMVKDNNGEDTDEPDFTAVEPSRTHSYLYNEAGLSRKEADDFVKANVDAAQKALDKVKKKEPKMGTSISAYKAAKAAIADELAQAQQQVDYWNAVKAEQTKAIAVERAVQAEKEKAIHDVAVIEEQQRKEAEAQAAAEHAAVGNENPMPHITEKWNAAPKVDGVADEMVLPNGERVKGHYVLTESGAATPSHQSTNGFQKSEGFPMDENGNTVNDRDYERDTDAQGVTRNIASQYDSRALQTPVVVSQDGVVLSGNGRTMAGELAAQNNTDTAYNEYLKQYAQKYGFTPEQVGQMQRPRVVFVPDERMPYTADTFAKFNQQEMKSQSKTEQAVKLGKIVDDGTFNRIVRTINAFDTLGDFYNDPEATTEAIKELQATGVINQQQLAEIYDGNSISAAGREILENTLIGKAFESNPDAVRMITEFKSMRQSVITALSEIANNIGLGEEFSLERELSDAIELCYNARHNGFKHGERVSSFARQTTLFGEEGETVADYQNATIMMLADLLNGTRVSQLKKTLAVYNNEAHDSANGQTDMFSGGVKSKEDILKDVLEILNHGTNEQQQSAINNAVERRKESVQQNGDVEQGNQENEQQAEINKARPYFLDAVKALYTKGKEFASKLYQMTFFDVAETPVFMKQYGLTGDKFTIRYGVIARHLGKDGRHDLPESVWEQLPKAIQDPFAITEYYTDKDKKEQKGYRLYTALKLSDGSFVVVSAEVKNAGRDIEVNAINTVFGRNTLSEVHDKLIYQSPTITPEQQALLNGNNPHQYPTEQELSIDKGNKNSDNNGKLSEKIAEAEAETDQNPTEKQKEAGNYKKGHVQIGAFDVTIENPKGSVRSGVDANGKKWETEMHNTYGYIRGTEGVDGDHIDVFLADDIDSWNGRKVFVIDQYNTDGSFDEHKVMLGFNEAEEAHAAYLSNYEKGWENTHKIVGTPVNIEDFEKWIDSSHRKTKAFAEYKSVQKSVANKQEITDAQRAVGNAVTELLKDAGIEVVTDVDEMRGVLGDEGAIQKMSVGSKEMVEWAVEAIGLVKPNLSKQTVRIVKADNHPFNTEQKTTDLKKEVVAYAEKNGIIGTMSNKESGDKGEVRISKSSISKFVDDSASDKSTDMNTHLSVLPIIKDVIKESIEAEVHPDYGKVDGVRSINNPINKNILIHRCYGATEINEKVYRVKVTLKEDITNNDAKKAYSYEVTKIELIENTNGEAVTPSSSAKSSITGANLLKGIEKSYDKGKYLLDESDNVSSVQTQFETQREISDKQYEKCEELLNALHNAGFKEFSISRSITHFGVSTYIQGQLGLKFRLSDHGVTSVSRIMSEDFISFETEPEDIVNYAKQKQEELNTQIAAKKAEKEKENKREAELDAKWKRIKHLFKGYVFKINNVGTYKHFADMESDNATYVMQKPYFYNGNKSNNKWRYEWAIPKEYDTNGRGEEKPSYEWIEAFDENKSTVNTTQFLRTNKGEMYGFVKDGVVYLDPAMMNPNTPVHEYTHLWDAALRKANPELWERGKELMKQTPLWEEVKNDPAYADIAGNEDLLASEAHARLSGKDGEGLLDGMVEQAKGKGVFDTAGAVSLKERVKQWLADTLAWVRDAFGKWSGKDLSGLTLEEFARMPVKDLASGRNMKDLMHKAGQVETVRENNPAEDDYHTWVRNVGDVKTFDEMLAEAERDHADYGDMTYPDITIDDLREAREGGYITVYSSKPIRQGVFVTPSRMNAEDYAGGGKVYEKRVPTSSVAWIGQDEGQLADTGSRNTEDAPLQMMFVGERGAARLDVAEEATTRLDNLDVAREMEREHEAKKERIAKLRESKAVEMTGKEYEGKYELNSKSAGAYILNSLRGEYRNEDTGTNIRISRKSQKVAHHDAENDVHLKSIAYIPDMIKNAIYIDSEKNVKGKNGFDEYKYYVVGLNIGGVDYTAKLVIGEKNGEAYYDHALTQIEKSSLISQMDLVKAQVYDNKAANFSADKDKRLISILQTNDKENARKIKMATGWERGKDGKWRYEVEDMVNVEVLDLFNDFEQWRDEWKLSELIDNKELFSAYPELRDMTVRVDADATHNEDAEGYYNPQNKEIVLSDRVPIYGETDTLVHEVQHAIQEIENFARGGNTEMFEDKSAERVMSDLNAATNGRLVDSGAVTFSREGLYEALRRITTSYGDTLLRYYDSQLQDVAEKYGYETIYDLVEDADNIKSAMAKYRSLAGEVEARNAQRRMGMTQEQRRATLAEETEDVAREDQLFLENALGTSAVMQEADKQTGDGQKSAGEDGRKSAVERAAAENDDVLFRSFTDGADADELYDALGGLSEWSSGAYNLMSALEDYYGGEIKEISGGAKHALENGLVPVPGKKHSGLDGEYHHIRFEAQNGEEFVESVPFIMAKDVEGDHGLLFRYADINRRFNEELQQQIDGTLPKGHVYQMGRPGALLRSTGIADFPIELRAQRLIDKATKFDHDFNLSEVKDLPSALQHPIAVFAYGDAKKAQNIVLQLNSGGKNFIVGISITPTVNGRKIEINSIRNVFPKDNHEWVKWITDGKLLYVDKEKIQPILSQLQTNPADVAKIKLDLDSATKIIENFENPSVEDENLRSGESTLTDDELSLANDPVVKLTGKSARTSRQRSAFAKRERQRMVERVNELVEKLGLDNVEVVTDASTLEGKKQRAKGFYSKSTGKITIVVPNHASVFDVEQTLLHEAVAHYGLRQLFGEHFDTFLDNVFANADESIRREIVEMTKAHDWDFHTATEEYLAGLAENTEFEHTDASWWNKIKSLFLGMLHKIGFEGFSGVTLTDNELRYILWRSYENLREPGRYRSILGEAADVAKQYELKVGNYADNGVVTDDMVAEAGVLEKVNERFNEELSRYMSGNMKQNEMLHLGSPSGAMKMFLPDLPIVMRQRVLTKGSVKKHNVAVDALVDMPKYLSNPILVFKRSEGVLGVLTEMKDRDGKNVCVAIELNRKVQNGGEVLEVNDIRSVHGRNVADVVYPIVQNGTLKWADKEKGLAYLSSASRYVQQEIDKQNLDSATKIVKNFENPSVEDKNVGDDVLFRSTIASPGSGVARDYYESKTRRTEKADSMKDKANSLLWRLGKSYADSMLALKAFTEGVLKETGGTMHSFEDAYKAENAMTSAGKTQKEAWERDYFKPIENLVTKLMQTGKSTYNDLKMYIVAKHGLERNEVLAERDFAAYQKDHPQGTKTLDDFRKRDYSGLTALTGESVVSDAEAKARQIADAYEQHHGKSLCDEWWNAVNAATKSSLKKRYDSGLMSKAAYEHTRDMFKYYIPLKGWDSNVAAKEYEYMSNSRGQTGSPRMITAKGRSSVADDPIATLAAASLTFINGRANPVSRPNCFAENSVFLRSSLTGV